MDDKTTRLFSALGVLVLVWIVVYWSFPVQDQPVVTSSLDEPFPGVEPDFTAEAPGGTPGESVGLVDAEMPAGGSGTQGGAAVVPPGDGGAPGVVEPRFEAYTVREGDNFEKIARRVFGDPKYAMVIARANPLQDPSKLRVGQTIRVPLDPSNIQGRPAESGAAPPAEPEPRTIEYTVRKGDTLSGIAKSFYGSIRYTDFLFRANKDRLRSEDDLRLGQVLLIPPLPDEAGD